MTPHYWTAAEMLLLQMDMLAYTLGPRGDEVIIGAGIPKEWIIHPMSVRGVPTPRGELSWSWDRERVRVEIAGEAPLIRLGSSFPPGTEIQIKANIEGNF